MKLDVVQSPGGKNNGQGPWYADGLKFTCSQCGNCCTGGPGFVWISKEEIVRLAEHLRLTPQQVVEKYCRKIDGQFSLKESRNSRGEYDCVFLTEEKVPRPAPAGRRGPGDQSDEQVTLTRRGCSIYSVRPLQCRTWPFWDGNLASKSNWDRAAQRCHGMNHGHRTFTQEQMESLRDAKDWPDNPPTSAPRKPAR
jgi:Fe-S-cluster containining protein